MNRNPLVVVGALLFGLLGAVSCGSARSSRVSDAQAPAEPTATEAKSPPSVSPVTLPPIEVPGPAVAACREGDARECWHAARLYVDGWGVPRDMVRVALYGGLACSSGIREACALVDLAYFGEPRRKLSPGLQSYKAYLDSFGGDSYQPPPCIEALPSKDRWGWAIYYESDCFRVRSDSDPNVIEGYEWTKVRSACFEESNGEACRGMVTIHDVGTDDRKALAPICRRKGLVCDFAEGDTKEETARFRERACLGRLYEACEDWATLTVSFGLPLEMRLAERITVEFCIHPHEHRLPSSFIPLPGEPEFFKTGCYVSTFPVLAASRDPADQALLSALSHWPEEIRAADCTGRFYDAHACALFVNNLDHEHLGLKEHRVPEEVRWKERMEALKSMCEKPPPFQADKPTIDRLCSDRASLEKEYKSFLAAHPPKGARP